MAVIQLKTIFVSKTHWWNNHLHLQNRDGCDAVVNQSGSAKIYSMKREHLLHWLNRLRGKYDKRTHMCARYQHLKSGNFDFVALLMIIVKILWRAEDKD